jgi:hypothetical protein
MGQKQKCRVGGQRLLFIDVTMPRAVMTAMMIATPELIRFTPTIGLKAQLAEPAIAQLA